jgi:hypothetical protein
MFIGMSFLLYCAIQINASAAQPTAQTSRTDDAHPYKEITFSFILHPRAGFNLNSAENHSFLTTHSKYSFFMTMDMELIIGRLDYGGAAHDIVSEFFSDPVKGGVHLIPMARLFPVGIKQVQLNRRSTGQNMILNISL